MIYPKTILNVIDNSGVLETTCIKILNKKKVGSIGDLVVLSVRKINPKSELLKKRKLLKGDVLKGLVVHTKKSYKRSNIEFIKSNINGVILMTRTGVPLGNRIDFALPQEIKKKGYLKMYSLTYKTI